MRLVFLLRLFQESKKSASTESGYGSFIPTIGCLLRQQPGLEGRVMVVVVGDTPFFFFSSMSFPVMVVEPPKSSD